MDASAIAAFALLLSSPAAAADAERSAANAGRPPAAVAAGAKASAESASFFSGGGIECKEEYRRDGTVVLAGRLRGQRLPLIPLLAAPGALSSPEFGGSIGPILDASDGSRCSLFINRREAAECLE